MTKSVRRRMVSAILLSIMMMEGFAQSSQAFEKATKAEDEAWELIWSDEFDGDGPADSSRWNYETGFVRNEEDQWYQQANVYQERGLLVIEGRCDTVENPRYEAGSRDWRRNRPYAFYTSGSINTRRHFSFQYGKLEVRARIPAVCGAWPAIWTLGDRMEWPSNGEIDVMEFYQVDGRPTILANAAWGNDRRFSAIWNTKRIPYTHFLELDRDWGEKFHTWLMDWDESYVKIYLDGELLNEIDLQTTVNGKIGNYANPFHQPHYILLDLAIGGINGGAPQSDTFPMRYEVDYVRVWKKK